MLEQQLLVLGVGVCATTPILIGLAVVGDFDVTWIGGLGWLSIAVWLVRLRVQRRLPRESDPSDTLGRYDLAAIAVAVLVAISGFWGREPTLGFGRDQQVYAEYAISLARFGTAGARLAAKDHADRELIRTVTQSRGMFLMPGALPARPTPDAPIESYLPLGWTVWLAFAYAVGGFGLLYGANALVMGASVILVFAIARRLTDSWLALGAAALFASIPLSVWIARISLSEPLALFLLLMLPFVTLVGGRRSLGLLPLIIIGACGVRVDMIVAVPALMLALVEEVGRPPHEGSWRSVRLTILALALACLAVCVGYAWLFPAYFADVARFMRPVLAVTFSIAILSCIPREFLQRCVRVTHSDRSSTVLVVALLGLFAYAALWRPFVQPYSLIPFAGGLTGTRDYREEAVRNLAAYTGWPVLIAAVCGACVAVRQAMSAAASRMLRILVMVSLSFGLLYLWDPHVSPDQPWGARRFVPVILPAIALFATMVVYAGLRRLRGWPRAVGALVLAVGSMPAWPAQYKVLAHADDRRSIAEIDSIARELPDDLVVVDEHLQNVATALLVAYHKRVAVVPMDTDIGHLVASRWIHAKMGLGRSPWLLEQPSASDAGARITEAAHWTVDRLAIKRTNRAPATETKVEVITIVLRRFDGIDLHATNHMFGADRTWGVGEHGFYTTDSTSFGALRYTDGGAWLAIPAHSLEGARALKFDLFTYAPVDQERWLRLLVNHRTIWNGLVRGGLDTVVAPLAPGQIAGQQTALLEIWSATTRVAVTGLDQRDLLGVGLIGVRTLQESALRAPARSMGGFASAIECCGSAASVRVGSQLDNSLNLIITNIGSVRWPTIRETGRVAGAVQIGLRWYRADSPQRIVGDNRWAMAVSLLPGDQIRMAVPLLPLGLDGKSLARGSYDVRIGMVREGYAWFNGSGSKPIDIPAEVSQ